MRVTFILPTYPWRPIGAFRVVYEYANRLAARGFEVSVVHPRRVKDEAGFWTPGNPYRRLRRQIAHMRDALLTPRVRWQAVDQRVKMLYVPEALADTVPSGDAVFATAWDTVQYVCLYPSSKGVKCHLVQSHDYWSRLDGKVDACWRSDVKKVVISKWLRDELVAAGCRDMAYIPNGINHLKYRLIVPIAERPKRVAMLYASAECKGSADGLRALEIAKMEQPDLRAVFFGIPKRPQNLPDWIEYFQNPGQKELVENVYNGSSVFLCPSIREAWPLPPAESMACGCAVASTDCGGNRDYAEHAVTALLSPSREPRALAKNLIRLLANHDLRKRIATEGHRRIHSFTWDRSTDLLEQFIEARMGEMTPMGALRYGTHCPEAEGEVSS